MAVRQYSCPARRNSHRHSRPGPSCALPYSKPKYKQWVTCDSNRVLLSAVAVKSALRAEGQFEKGDPLDPFANLRVCRSLGTAGIARQLRFSTDGLAAVVCRMVMVEPLLATLNPLLSNPVFAARPALACVALRLVTRAMAHDTASLDVLASRSKRTKGKEKALPDNDWVRCSQWLFTKKCESFPPATSHGAVIIFAAVAGKSRSDTSQASPSSPTRAHGSHYPFANAIPPPIFATYKMPLAGSQSTQTRHASTNAQSHDSPNAPNAVEVLSRFNSGRPIGKRLIGIDEAWDAYMLIRDRNSALASRPETLLPFVDRAATAAEKAYEFDGRLEALQRWGQRLRDILIDAGRFIEPSSEDDFTRHCLLVRCAAITGDVSDALTGFPRINTLRKRVDPAVELRTYESVLSASFRVGGPVKVLDIIVTEWDAVGERIFSPQFKDHARSVNGALQSLSDTAFAMLDEIEFPAAVMAGRKDHGAKVERIRMGELLVTFMMFRGAPEDALAVLEEMHRQLLRPSLTLQLELVRSLTRTRAFELANTLFSTLTNYVEPGAEPRDFVFTGLHLFALQGDVAHANEYFGMLVKRKALGLASIALKLHASAVNGDASRVVGMFRHYFPVSQGNEGTQKNRPNIHHYTALIMAHAQCRDYDGMNLWLETMMSAGINPDHYVYEVILNSFAMRGEIDAIATIMDQMRKNGLKPKSITYTTVITLLAQRRDPVAAEALYKRALREGIVPDRQMIGALMNAHAESGSWRGVIRAFDYMMTSKTRQIRPRVDVFNILLKSYVLLGAPFRVVSDVFRKIEDAGVRPTIHTFSLLIQSACDAGLMDVATSIFRELEKFSKDWETGLHINAYALTIIMAGYLRLGNKLKAKKVYDDMLARGIQATSITFGSILRGYSNEGNEESIRLAQGFLRSLMDTDPKQRTWLVSGPSRLSGFEHIYGPLMASYSRNSQPEEVEKLFQDMMDSGGEPTLSMLTLLLNAYRNTRDVQSARQVWQQIFRLGLRYSQVEALFDPSDAERPREDLQRQANILCVPLSIYIDVLSSAGFHEEVAEVWQKLKGLGFAFDSHNWNHLAVVLIRAGEPERAFQILERVTPLTFDDERPVEELDEDDVKPVREGPTSAARRAAASALAEWNIDQVSLENPEEGRRGDFAHPLHVLYQISPSWNVWRPHQATLWLLSRVLNQLESGRLVQPILPADSDVPEGNDWDENKEVEAAEILGRIRRLCPKTVTAVREHQWQQSAKEEMEKVFAS
ncbi:hypothetical protein EW146_g4230 [Bondarzewia mesenterica]|uniref:Pentacotripeptide-repeat region of PRORP domain-containing protein n=1 Tax=Bondarzewia mesenterica TaxID=1095465 RepID=A0A4S4LX16_9AGAM|nr:hypothetical protein EW146_g4230 [Bondarzewia mesenterica]